MSRADRVILGSVALAAIVGIGISIYLTIVHYQGGNPVCSTTGVVDCAKVVNSPYGQILGTSVPTSAAGIGWFLVSLALVALQWSRPDSVPLARLALAWGILGIITILY